MECKILEGKKCNITNPYSLTHQAVDICKDNDGKNDIDYIIAHSKGKIIFLQDGYKNLKGSIGNESYGNCIKIEHENGFNTLYAHMESGLLVKNGQNVVEGQKIGFMSDSGNAYGKHLHFEVWKNNTRINPTEYLNKNFSNQQKSDAMAYKYKKGDIVTINGVYYTSTSIEKLKPLKNTGKITKIIEGVINPYLLDNGAIGWVNDECIIDINNQSKYISNTTYNGESIVDALNQINIDSSYNNRVKIAKINEIYDYKGTAEQNVMMLNLLKQGKLKK